MESSTTETWVERVMAWRASGERAEAFSRRGGYAASTLRWWASRLKREMATATASASTVPSVQLARVIRTPPAPAAKQPLVLDVVDAGIRITVEAGADPSTLAMVLDVVRAQAGGSSPGWRSGGSIVFSANGRVSASELGATSRAAPGSASAAPCSGRRDSAGLVLTLVGAGHPAATATPPPSAVTTNGRVNRRRVRRIELILQRQCTASREHSIHLETERLARYDALDVTSAGAGVTTSAPIVIG